MYTLRFEVHAEGSVFTAIAGTGETMAKYAISPEHTDLIIDVIGDLLNKIDPVFGGKLRFVDEDKGKKKKGNK